MIDVPEEIKNLLMKDGVRKNIRVIFLDRSLDNLTNKDIVKDSLSFTESICSQNELKFGLSEESIIEFKVYGIENVIGAQIQVLIEIDCSELSEEWCENNAEIRGDISFPIYAIDYGTFYIQSCKKEKNNIRTVVAYSNYGSNKWPIGNMEKYRRRMCACDHPDYVCSQYRFDAAKFLISNGYIPSNIYPWSELPMGKWGLGITNCHVKDHSCSIGVSIQSYRYVMKTVQETDVLLGFNNVYYERLDMIRNMIYGFFDEVEGAGYEIQFVGTKDSCIKYYLDNMVPAIDGWYSTASLYDKIDCCYPFTPLDKLPHDVVFYLPYSIKINLKSVTHVDKNGNTIPPEIICERYYDIGDIPKLYAIDVSSEPSLTLSFKNYDDINIREMLQGISELNGAFAFKKRDGLYKRIYLENNGLFPTEDLFPYYDMYPEDDQGLVIDMDNYEYCEVEDEYTKPFAYVYTTYTSSKDNSLKEMFIWIVNENDYLDNPNNYQGYSCSDNFFISNMKWEENKLRAILSKLAEHLAKIQYMPMTMKMRGLPYLEPGDLFYVNTPDGYYRSFILRRELEGVQTLMDVIDTK